MIKIVAEYSKYIEELPELLKESPFKTSHFIEKLELPKATYYRKLKDKSFTVEEVEKLTEILFPNEAYLAEMDDPVADSRKKIHNVKRKQYDKLMDQVKKKFLDS
ncbi:MAG: hypothetical protein ACTIJ9_02690 [Aequorivita sp.]